MKEQNQTGGAASAVVAVIVVLALAVAALMVFPSLFLARGPASSTAANSAGSTVPTGKLTEVTVTVQGMSFVPAMIEVPAGNTLRIILDNTGDQRHDLAFPNGAATEAVAPGASATVDVGVVAGDTEGWCTLPGHRQMGMVLQVVAVGETNSGPEAEPTENNGTGHGNHTSQSDNIPQMDALIAAAKETEPYPAELEPLSSDENSTHEYEFVVTEDEQALVEGIVRPLWTFNGTSPGPTLHGKVGDRFVITLKNNGTMGHSIDFHAGDIAPDEPMRTIEPGESLVYDFVARRSGIWMYHCSTMPMSLHIANGMFGAVIIEPDDLPEVDQSYVLVQSDVYLGAEDGVAPTAPELVAFNGRPFQYDAHPLQAKVGERVRIWVLDAGPNTALSFHIVGAQFDTVWTEGAYSVYRGQSAAPKTIGETGAQVLPLMAAQGGFVEFVPVETGHYPIVNHIMSFAERGAHGVLSVTN